MSPQPAAPGAGSPLAPPYAWDDPTSSDDGAGNQTVFVIGAILGGLVAAAVAALGWAYLANPPTALVTRRGVFITGEANYNQQVSVTLWFLLIGVVLGFVCGLVLAWLGRSRGVAVVVAVLLLCAAASGVSAWLGVGVFGPDLDAQLAGARVGDLVTSELSITSEVAYLGWPMGGMLGVLAGIALAPVQDKRPQLPAVSRTVVIDTTTGGH